MEPGLETSHAVERPDFLAELVQDVEDGSRIVQSENTEAPVGVGLKGIQGPVREVLVPHDLAGVVDDHRTSG